MYDDYGLFIDGAWRAARDGGTIELTDPADETPLGRIAKAGTADLDDALAAAAKGFAEWKRTPPWTRSAALRATAAELRKRAEDIALSISREMGKALPDARGEVNSCIDQFDWHADEARRIYGHTLDGREPDMRIQVRYEPVGPVAAFTPWNFPALLPARKIAPALAAGCSIIIKPAEEAPTAVYLIAEAAKAAGVPAGVLNVVTGDPAEVSRHLIASPIIRKVSFTGSIPVGKQLLKLCAEGVKRVSMELGGHAPVLVFADADPVRAAEVSARVKFRNAGQVCISPTRFYVHEAIEDAFAENMARIARGLKLGRGSDAGTEVGPMANKRGRERALGFIEDAVAKGAEVLTGGSAPAEMNRGWFLSPTVLGRVPDEARIMQEEPFGPIAPITTFTEFDDVISRANSVPYGLAGYVFSASLATANRAAEALEVGMVGVNDLLISTAEAPFGGVKESGMGREGGRIGILEYLSPKLMKFRYS